MIEYRVELGDHHLLLSKGKITGSVIISDEVNSLNIIELIPMIKRYTNNRPIVNDNVIILTNDHTLRWAKIVDDELRILYTISNDVSKSVLIGCDAGHPRSSGKNWHTTEKFNRDNIYSVNHMTDGRLVFIAMNKNGDRRERELSIPEGIKSMVGGVRKYYGFTDSESIVTIATNSNRILMCRLILLNNVVEAELIEVATIPGLIDVVRMGSMWLSIADPDPTIPSEPNCCMYCSGCGTFCPECGDYDYDCDTCNSNLRDECIECQLYRDVVIPYCETGTRFSIITLKSDAKAVFDIHEQDCDGYLLILGEMILPKNDSVINLHHPIRFVKFLDNGEVMSEDDKIYTIHHSYDSGKFKIKLKED